MCRKGENIRKRKDGRWEARYIKYRDPEGKIHYGSLYGKTYGEVKDHPIYEGSVQLIDMVYLQRHI